mmetsp:Transcript_36286/g.116245  ORF Transcript_36286/g.116245 Transcript_36286/m.116245 type:complete len:329 (-) Transcript_36286:217-1203(-)
MISEERDWKATAKDHRSWKTLPAHIRRDLRLFHQRCGCETPWPVTLETPAMLQMTWAPSFLTAHPNMRFRVVLKPLPSFTMRYHDNGASELTGRQFPKGRSVPVLEEFSAAAGSFKVVPPHQPVLMSFAVVGECVWTRACAIEMCDFYGSEANRGALFDWPDGNAVPVCPATGDTVTPDQRTVHLLVACNVAGSSVATGDATRQLTRIIPRVLTIDGYKRMFATKDHQQVDDNDVPRTHDRRARVDFYPTAMRAMLSGGKCRVLPASALWAEWHANGYYLAYERGLEVERKELFDKYGPDGPFRFSCGNGIRDDPDFEQVSHSSAWRT